MSVALWNNEVLAETGWVGLHVHTFVNTWSLECCYMSICTFCPIAQLVFHAQQNSVLIWSPMWIDIDLCPLYLSIHAYIIILIGFLMILPAWLGFQRKPSRTWRPLWVNVLKYLSNVYSVWTWHQLDISWLEGGSCGVGFVFCYLCNHFITSTSSPLC